MAIITETKLPRANNSASNVGASRQATVTTIGSSDTFNYTTGTGQLLILRNPTGGTITPVIDGGFGTIYPVEGLGGRSVSGGLPSLSTTAGTTKIIPLDTVKAYLQGTITITSGSGLQAILISNVE